ncbi:MAG: RNA polymerase factor sigma-32 [Rickettsiales bacterium]|jgi:RNA polymerase sigma-32 factor|nr:RNA polymerase factor sigma-32 [Rickettsiales bacterium]
MKSTKTLLPAISDDGSMARYIQMVQGLPILSKEDEQKYAKSFAKKHDKLSAEKLVSSHLRLVVSMAYELKNYGIPIGELIASGNIGLMQALQKFDVEKGFRFSTYAGFWIKAEMYDLILNNWSMVKIGSGAAQKKVFFNLARAKRALGIADTRLSADQVKQIARKLEVPEAEVENMNDRMHYRDQSLNAAKYDDGEAEMLDFVEDDHQQLAPEILEQREDALRARELLQRHMADLPEREREILIARRLRDPVSTLEELSAKYGISRERVRQIEEKAYGKLREAVLNDDKENKRIRE